MGLIGMWKAFEELERLGWVAPGKRPRMVAVQAAGCAPVARAFDQGAEASEASEERGNIRFRAACSQKPYGDAIMLKILRESQGTALALTDDQILASILDWARNKGVLLSPEGAAATAAYDSLLKSGFLKPTDRVVLFNTGAGLKYTDVIAEAMKCVAPLSVNGQMSGDPPGRTLCPVDSNDRLVGVRAVRMLSPIDFNDRVRGPQMLDVNSRLAAWNPSIYRLQAERAPGILQVTQYDVIVRLSKCSPPTSTTSLCTKRCPLHPFNSSLNRAFADHSEARFRVNDSPNCRRRTRRSDEFRSRAGF